MNYYNQLYQQPKVNPLEKRVQELEEDNKQPTKAIEDLNACYSQKIYLLEQTISQQNLKYEELLEWKQQHIDKSLFDVERYEVEIEKMIAILDNAHLNFEKQKCEFVEKVQSQDLVIKDLKEKNEELNEFNDVNEGKIEEMVRLYTEEIEKLKQQLRELRE